MSKIIQMNIYAMRGVGIEAAKNRVWADSKSWNFFDSYIIKINELSSNYFLKEEDIIKKNRYFFLFGIIKIKSLFKIRYYRRRWYNKRYSKKN